MNDTGSNDKKIHEILARFNDTRAPYPHNKTIGQMFEEQAQKTPQAPAIIFLGQSMTYKELNCKANQLARVLRKEGLGPDSTAAIMLDRSMEMMIGLFGILKAGGAYLPIDPHTPRKRIELILKDSNSHILLTSSKYKDNAHFEGLIMDLENSGIYQGPSEDLPPISGPDNLVYVIYTSGSTGTPKGAMITHRSLVNRLHWMQKRYPLTQNDVILQKTPFVFDVSLWELFWWSTVGAKVCLLRPGFEKFPQAIVETVENNKVTVMHFVPSMFNVFLQYIQGSGESARIASLKRIFASGETLTPFHVNTFNELLGQTNGSVLINLYGPTEATVDVSYYDCPTGHHIEKIPIGKPIDNTMFSVLKDGTLLGPGGEGELCILGVGLARGYLNRPELTSEKFIKDVYSRPIDSEYNIMYRTGDLAKWMDDGNLEFFGRIDHQVKIRGLRIELGEIESALLGHDAINECVVIVRRISETVILLVAYVVTTRDCDRKELDMYLKEYLPDYMIPNFYRLMESLPQTVSGKVDLKALPEFSPGSDHVL